MLSTNETTIIRHSHNNSRSGLDNLNNEEQTVYQKQLEEAIRWFELGVERKIKPYEPYLFEWGSQYEIEDISHEELPKLAAKYGIVILGLEEDGNEVDFDLKTSENEYKFLITCKFLTVEDNYICEDEEEKFDTEAKQVENAINIEMNIYKNGEKGFILSFRKLDGDYFIYKKFFKLLAFRL